MRPVEWGMFQPLLLVSLRSHLPSPCAATLPLGLQVSSRQDRWHTFALRGPLDRFELHGYRAAARYRRGHARGVGQGHLPRHPRHGRHYGRHRSMRAVGGEGAGINRTVGAYESLIGKHGFLRQTRH